MLYPKFYNFAKRNTYNIKSISFAYDKLGSASNFSIDFNWKLRKSIEMLCPSCVTHYYYTKREWNLDFPNSISHLFHSCSHATLIWDKISLLCSFISPHHPSPINFISSSHPHFKKLGHLLQSSAIFSISVT